MRKLRTSRLPVTCLTPRGRLVTSLMTSLMSALSCAVWPGIFTTVVQPAARAGASERISKATGAFHGTLMPATPIGSRTRSEKCPCSHSATRPYSVHTSAAQ